MAGVGFELQKLVRKGTLTSTIQAFLYGSTLASGPMILTIITVSVIGWMSFGLFHAEGSRLFTVTIVYSFAFSLILSGPTQLVFTRLVADKDFSKQHDQIYPAFMTSIAVITLLALLVSVPFYMILEIYAPLKNPFLYKLVAVITFVGICNIWQVMGFISTTKEYQKVALTYLGGTVVSIVLAYLLIPVISITGGLTGFAAGQWLILILLFHITTKNLEKPKPFDRQYLHYFRKYPHIALNGLFYNAGLWADKMVFWFHFKQQQDASLFYTFNFYDVPNFLAFLTIVPALAYFLILTETNFYKDYREFIYDILQQPLFIIENKKQDMIETVKRGMKGMVRMQGIITLLILVFAEPILVFLSYRGISIWLFRILLIGVFFHVVNLNLNIIFLYYELRKKALWLTIFFATTNLFFTLITIQLGTKYFGFGFLASTLLTCVISWRILMRSIRQIDFTIFASQPLEAVVQIPKRNLWKKTGDFVTSFKNRNKTKDIYPEYFS